MKFTKEQAIKELEAKVPAKDKDLDLGRTISEAVDNSLELIGQESEMELSDFVEKVFKQVKTSIGLTHSENSKVANKMQGQIEDLQKRLDEKNEPPKDGDGDGQKIKALMDELENIKSRLEKADVEKSVSEKRSELASKMGESIKDKDWIDEYLKLVTVTADTDVEAKAKDYVAFYNKTQVKGGRTTPKPAGCDDDDIDSNVKSVVAAAAKIKKSMGGGPVTSTTTNNNNN